METTSQSTSQSRFWQGFALAFALLVLGSCGLFLTATGLSRLSLAELQGNGAAWTPPPITPTPEAPAVVEASENAVDGGLFAPGQQVRNVTNSRVNVRETAGYLAKPATDVVAQLQPGATMEILGPSAVADGLNWWLVRLRSADGRTVDGWVAEATASGVNILGE